MYVAGCAAICAEGFALVGSAVQSAILCALLSVIGSGSTLDKARFVCLYRAIHVKFSLI